MLDLLKFGAIGCLIFAAFNFVTTLSHAGGRGDVGQPMQQVIVFLLLAAVIGAAYGIGAGIKKLVKR